MRNATVRPTLQRSMNFRMQLRDENTKGVSKNVNCYYGNKNYNVESCEEFKKLNGQEHFKFIRSRKLCNNCLSAFHFAAGCKRKNNMTSKHDAVLAFE